MYHFAPNLLDDSEQNINSIEQRAKQGSDLALSAYITLAVNRSNYREHVIALLLDNAVHGSVLALTTLAEYASVGYGFERPDLEAALFFEYLAYLTGSWCSAGTFEFRPQLSSGWSQDQCMRAVARVGEIGGSEMFMKLPDAAPTCLPLNTKVTYAP